MSGNEETFERYPTGTVIISNANSISIWLIGAYILWAAFGPLPAVIFVIYCLALEVNLLRKSCVNCYYYGKVCFSGRGKVCAGLFGRGDSSRFASRSISWKDILPDLAVSIVPIICGIGLLIVDFSWIVLALTIALLALSTAGNALIRGRLACKHCRQRLLGCPAERLFRKEAEVREESG